MFRVKVRKVGYSLNVTIPKEIAETLKLVTGDSVLMEVKDNELIIRKSPESMSIA
jgi:putative addiction module antidote